MTSSTSNASAGTPPMMGSFDINHMFQMYSAGIMMRMMNTVNDNTGGLFTYDKIIALIVLFLLNDIKKWVLEFVEFLKKQIADNVPGLAQKAWAICIAYYYTLYGYAAAAFMRPPPPSQCAPAFNEDADADCVEAVPTERTMTVELDINAFNMNALWQYIQMAPEERAKLGATVPDGVQVSTADTVSTAIVSKENITTNMTYKAIEMQITPDLKMDTQNLVIDINNNTGTLVNSSIANTANILVFDIENNAIFKNIDGDIAFDIKRSLLHEFKCINEFKLTDTAFIKLCKKVSLSKLSKFINNKKVLFSEMVSEYALCITYNIPIYKLWLMYLKDNYMCVIDTFTKFKQCVEMYLFLLLIFKIAHDMGLNINIINNIISLNLKQVTIKLFLPAGRQVASFYIPINNVQPEIPLEPCQSVLWNASVSNSAIILGLNNYLSPDATSASKSVKTVITLTTTDLNKTNQAMYSEFLDFYRTVLLKAPEATKSAQFSKTRDITVYAISYKKTDEIKTVENPEYVEWMEMFGNIAKTATAAAPQAAVEDQSQKPSGAATAAPSQQQQSYDMLAKMEAYRMKPPKTIEIRSQKTELVCEKVNQLYKNMNSLYLREADKHKITSIVDKFKTRRDFYEQLGIPYKLGIMLHGHPGTGKSSTIKAIASTLEKDIYFVNLKNVRTNAELKGIFEHINEKCNGGVIVFEDMDASCEVIKRRHCGANATDIVETRPDLVADITDHVADDKLTLSYLLNLFDGTICRDGTIFAITTNHLENIDPALHRAGRVDVKIEFRKCDHYQIREIFRHVIGRELAADVLAAIPEWKYSPAEIIYEIMHYGLDDSVTDREIMSAFINTV